MTVHFSTQAVKPLERYQQWQDIIGQSYFELQLKFLDKSHFDGDLRLWQLGDLSLSRLCSSPTSYQRLKSHLHYQMDEYFLVTIPCQDSIHFSQMGRQVECAPGCFLLEHSNEPYQFDYHRDNTLWVLKVPGRHLRNRLRSPDRYCAMRFDAQTGVGNLFVNYVQLITAQLDSLGGSELAMVGKQLTELLCTALEGDGRLLTSSESVVRAAHLRRIEDYVRLHLGDPGLSTETIAGACHISTRYLHSLFKDTGQTFSQWLRDQRLDNAYQSMMGASLRQPLSVLAYQWGFTDQSHFSRVFKQKYGCTPGELKRSIRSGTSTQET
ncbi:MULTISPECIES: helix-turn-helix domain-containing protein [Aquitalea]|uniref:AraC family transcriptional regulator n=1 Tax=Aquitalea magnusonii TaxID=332411 RepID=A0A318IRW7_9NEIS|nr:MULTISPECIES: helix-turn-helix domain-containing protein [Aquitalea]PXX37924.1 AraC family transcriptional regulator [Aquitalea magnusonii]